MKFNVQKWLILFCVLILTFWHHVRSDDGSQIDIMVIYSLKAGNHILPSDNSVALRNSKVSAQFEIILQYTQQALWNSGIIFWTSRSIMDVEMKFPHFRLVHVDQVYFPGIDNEDIHEGNDLAGLVDECNHYSFGNTSKYLPCSGSGLDKVMEMREEYKADVVVILIPGLYAFGNEVGGLQNNRSPITIDANCYIFLNVVWYTGAEYFAHELGHLLGCAHPRQNYNGDFNFDFDFYNYAYGYLGTNIRDLMSQVGDPGYEVQAYSNPDKIYAYVRTYSYPLHQCIFNWPPTDNKFCRPGTETLTEKGGVSSAEGPEVNCAKAILKSFPLIAKVRNSSAPTCINQNRRIMLKRYNEMIQQNKR
jgi:hypothetical protein